MDPHLDPVPDRRPGTYALWLRIDSTETIAIGRRHRLTLTPGWLVYVGSACGPGGVAARLAHHLHSPARPHWHIDYLRPYCERRTVWFSHDPLRRECQWATLLATDLGGVAPPFRFGASDCRCPAHLYRFAQRPSLAAFTAALHRRCPEHAVVFGG